MNSILIETQFLPCIEFFCVVKNFESIEIEYCEHYVKQSYRNHTLINTANGVHKLVIPLASKGNRSVVKDLQVDNSQNWSINFWRTIESAYRKAPFFEHYANDLHQVLFKQHEFLINLNEEILELCFSWLQWDKKLIPTKQYTKSPSTTDFRNVVLSKKPYSTRNFYKPVAYTQVFGGDFVENLSIIDLIFCKGPEAGGIIKASSLNL